jgi:AraC family transcriptional regulator, transcriptional activator of pobA
MRTAKIEIVPFKDNGGGPRIEVIRFQPGHHATDMPLHGHGFYELIYIESGTGQHSVAGRQHSIGAGSLFAIAPGEPHDPSTMKRASGYLIVFTADALQAGRSDSDVFSALPGEFLLWVFLRVGGHDAAHVVVPRVQRASFVSTVHALERECTSREHGWEFCARAYLGIALTQAARIHATCSFALRPAQQRPVIGAVFQYIEARYMRPISLADVAKAVNKSAAHLTDVVRRQTGRTVGEWITERRMVEARRQLSETDLTIQNIAASLAYDDESYFSRVFRKHHQVSPSTFRARLRP